MLRRWAVRASWLLCASIVVTCLDRVPDPPAIKQRTIQSQALDLIPQLPSAVDENQQSACYLSDPRSPTLLTARKGGSEICFRVGETPLLRQAADPSPPARVL